MWALGWKSLRLCLVLGEPMSLAAGDTEVQGSPEAPGRQRGQEGGTWAPILAPLSPNALPLAKSPSLQALVFLFLEK